MRSNLYIVGTNHLDLMGRERLDYLLQTLSPSIIALEMNKDREGFIDVPLKKRENKMEKQVRNMNFLNEPQIKTLIEGSKAVLHSYGYEVNSSKEYVKTNPKTLLEYIDIEGVVKIEDENIIHDIFADEIKNPKLMKRLLRKLDKGAESYINLINKNNSWIYRLKWFAELRHKNNVRLFNNPTYSMQLRWIFGAEELDYLKRAYNPERDKYMSERIRELYKNNGNLLAIVGLEHCGELRENLKDLIPKIFPLSKYKKVK